MVVTWIVGNGFDINLGLKTGYRDFLNSRYLKDNAEDERLKKLREVCSTIHGWETAEHWSDLEMLLGQSSQGYEGSEVELFHLTFEDMQEQFTEYVHDEELKLPDELPDECVREFVASICDFGERMVYADRGPFIRSELRDHIHYNFISLNYTSALDKFLSACTSANGIITTHEMGNSTFNDTRGTLLHLHGVIAADGDPQDIVFGVSEPSQIANDAFAQDSYFTRLWVKEQKNVSHYGNGNVQQAETLINDSRTICVYGCSLGASDKYLWMKVGTKLKKDANCRLILFVHGLPNRHGHAAWQYEQQRRARLEAFRDVADIASDDSEALDDRITVVRSEDYFLMNGLRSAAESAN